MEEIEKIIEEYGTNVMRLAYFYLKDRDMAEDVTQDVFLKIWQKVNGFRGDSSIKTWILRITVNLCKDRLRSWSWRKLRLMGDEFWETLGGSEPGPHLQAVTDERKEILVKAVLSLPVKYREVVVLHYYQGLLTREIAEVTGLKEATVRSRLARARAQLKVKLVQEGITDA